MRKIFKVFVIAAFMVCSATSYAQNEGVLISLLPQLPYSNYFNPGIRVPYKGLIGFGVSASLRNSFAKNSSSDKVTLNDFYNNLDDKNNQFNASFSDVVNLGFRTGRFFFNIDCRVKLEDDFKFSKDFVGVFLVGDTDFTREKNLDVEMETMYYSEIGVGVQYDVNRHLTVGVRPKLLLGISNSKVNSTATLAMDSTLRADMNVEIQASGNSLTNVKDVIDMVNVFDMYDSYSMDLVDDIGLNNIGFGVDFGASYVFNKHFGVAASVRDIGFIKWKDTKSISKKENIEVVDDFSGVVDPNNFEFDYNKMLDKVVDNVWGGNDALSDGGGYKTKLNTSVNMQVYYEFHPTVRFTAIGQMRKIQDEMKTSFTFAYSGSFGRFVNLAANYTISKQFGNSLGAGLALHIGAVNIYAVTDNVLMFKNMGKEPMNIVTTNNCANIRAGVVISLGRFQKTSDRMAGI